MLALPQTLQNAEDGAAGTAVLQREIECHNPVPFPAQHAATPLVSAVPAHEPNVHYTTARQGASIFAGRIVESGGGEMGQLERLIVLI